MYEFRDQRLPERFWEKVEVNPFTGCWEWTAAKNRGGYGYWDNQRVHRLTYKVLIGPIPNGLEPDHTCRVRHCCNPADLELVTHRVNVLRGVAPTARKALQTDCESGHPLVGENLYLTPDGRRQCKSCRAAANRAWRARRGGVSVAS